MEAPAEKVMAMTHIAVRKYLEYFFIFLFYFKLILFSSFTASGPSSFGAVIRRKFWYTGLKKTLQI
jgi:hypothetical protein